MKREKMQELFNEILDNIIIYLYKIKDNFNIELELQFYSHIEEDLERLLQFKNYSILDILLYEKVEKCYMVIIKYSEDTNFTNKCQNYQIIIESLYQNFRYIEESILFMVESIFL